MLSSSNLNAVYGLQRILRRLPVNKGLDLILESHGGSIDVASTIASLCHERFRKLRVIIPFYAKSAATLVALAADERILTCFTQLGPVDPQVRHPTNQTMWFPAHSIKEALEQVESTKDRYVKVAMADKLDPFLIGAYRDAIAAAKQYVEQIVEHWKVPNKADIISAFTDKYKSHGYPIDISVLKALNVPYTMIQDDIETSVFDLHEICYDIISKDVNEGIIILAKTEYLFMAGDFRNRENFQLSNPSAPDNATKENITKK